MGQNIEKWVLSGIIGGYGPLAQLAEQLTLNFLVGCLNRLQKSKLTKTIAFIEGEVSKTSKTVYMSLTWLHRGCTGRSILRKMMKNSTPTYGSKHRKKGVFRYNWGCGPLAQLAEQLTLS